MTPIPHVNGFCIEPEASTWMVRAEKGVIEPGVSEGQAIAILGLSSESIYLSFTNISDFVTE
jgi:hypothetical protein